MTWVLVTAVILRDKPERTGTNHAYNLLFLEILPDEVLDGR
jgi:hypothetical protein